MHCKTGAGLSVDIYVLLLYNFLKCIHLVSRAKFDKTYTMHSKYDDTSSYNDYKQPFTDHDIIYPFASSTQCTLSEVHS